MRIAVIDEAGATARLDALAGLLMQSIEDGALVGFVLPFDVDQARSYWQGIFPSLTNGERLLICAYVEDNLVGTVQLYLSPEPNALHRAEVYMLLVHRDFQRQGIGSALMASVEDEARSRKRTLLLLDTAEGGASERLYRRMNWRQVGVVPHHFVDPFGKPRASIYFMKHLTP
ncbi:GNAT family N-acetyltransferase [Mesorhizobium sp. M2A.F.Ca.ET.037.01.1.1]|uniref:GNAT family N-acetyltransferase n=1 Tax=unclassified Mesorhizobium TaxID=325217 RepID=UPI000F7581BB|nr:MULTISPECIES: GNAT family N-acetyltransferase [unclassified Mesorhizobium]RUX79992.1 GNAT family N-acetyltransferase [Mesorhizobium sp. M2A.F.Ca.ET.040.01.1.1]RVC66382.1 GNAT family N-acetyltransferase [Mesorhizobium sp. M00.F.Ca.ET.038.03.1.1]RVC75859.1 GNAT family N-acetyltransferase [Mesorhizobium sp. M2A.F.Ca.ET.046.02.1.1]AZO06411.1 GNAT family N-acetyltransferase [Mesorhizobium sp. M2A.F.Ca.ET.043.02.1.1]AZO33123.1 GNAT family N-acetyltransferase [Mesorhizobium sp. M2A.F.Ca.ET.046.03.